MPTEPAGSSRAGRRSASTVRRVLPWSLALVAVVSSTLFVWLVRKNRDYVRTMQDRTRSDAIERTQKAAGEIETVLREASQAAERLADELSAGDSLDEVKKEVRQTVVENPDFYGSAITYRPYGLDPARRLYSGYYYKPRPDEKLEYLQADRRFDYSESGHEWYVDAMAQGSRWSEPFWDEGGQILMNTYSAVFYEPGSDRGASSRLGVATIDLSMDRIRKIIQSLDLGPGGFGSLISRKGVYIYHPTWEYVAGMRNIRDVAREANDDDRLAIAGRAARGERGILDHVSLTSGEESWLVFEPVPSSGWSLQNTFIKSEVAIDRDYLRRGLIWATVAGIVFLLCVAALASRVERGGRTRIWLCSWTASLLLISAIGIVWYLSLSLYTDRASGSTPGGKPAQAINEKLRDGAQIVEKSALRSIMNYYDGRALERRLKTPVFLPTGILIDTMKFLSPNEVLLTGSVWQRRATDLPADVEPGFSISNATDVTATEVERREESGYQVVRWDVQAVLHQAFNSAKYPLDRETIAIGLSYKNLGQKVFLVPDLDSYELISPSLLPGLEKGLVMPGWTLKKSFFELRPRNDSHTTFGVRKAIDEDQPPLLAFKIGIQRNFVDAFISNLTPLIIVAITLFAILMHSEDLSLEGGVSLCVGVFFVIVFSHIDVRQRIAAQEIFYLEYFYLLIYGSILWVSLIAFLGPSRSKLGFVAYEDKLIPQALYWPFLLGALFAVTVKTFY